MIHSRISRFCGAIALSAAMMIATAASAQMIEDVAPADPQPADDQLVPGLAVAYVDDFFNDLSEMMGYQGEPGPDLANLDATPGRNEPVLTSGQAMGVGAFIRGLIRFDAEGTWTFRVHSNDGVEVTIGGQRIHIDPYKHSDTMSPPILVAIEEPGWYPIEVDYFQRKGTATLQLLWTPPDGGPEEIVPPAAFAHLAE